MKIWTKLVVTMVATVMLCTAFPVGAFDLSGDGATVIQVTEIDFTRPAKNIIEIVWTDSKDYAVASYAIYRRNAVNSMGTGDWKLLAVINSDGISNGVLNRYQDVLKTTANQQYEYVITVNVKEPAKYTAAFGKTLIASNVKVCIDPGHYGGKNVVEEKYPYCEGDFTLKIAAELYRELKKYGISASFTRTTPNIVMNGLVNEGIDDYKISIRGEYAKVENCDLFVSLHTNSNGENAHGYPTFMQPISMNNPIIIVNVPASQNQSVLNMATSIGMNLVNTNRLIGISTVTNYIGANANNVPGWTNELNDSISISGYTVTRYNSKGTDYYGVLRGSASVGVPGMIIEHGFHSVPEMRKAAMDGGLEKAWGKADAYGIAYGLGFITSPVY